MNNEPLTQTTLNNDVAIETEAAAVRALDEALRHVELFRHHAARVAGLLNLDIEVDASDGDWAYEIRRVDADWQRRRQGLPEPEPELMSFSAYDPLEEYLHPDHVRQVWMLAGYCDAVASALYVSQPDDVDMIDVLEYAMLLHNLARQSDRADMPAVREAANLLHGKIKGLRS